MNTYKEVKTIEEFDYQTQKQFTRLYPKPIKMDFNRFNKDNRDKTIPSFEDLEIVAFNIGLENYEHGIINANEIFNILKSTKMCNKKRSLFTVFVHAVYSSKISVYHITKYWKTLTQEQKDQLDQILENYLVHEYNKHVEHLNYIENSK